MVLMRGPASLCAVALLTAALQDNVPFRAQTDIVPVYATVRGADGHLVTDLQQDDFELRDRGVPAPIAVFSAQAEPITLAVVVDMTGGMFSGPRYGQLRDALNALVASLGPQDRARFVTFSANEIAVSAHLTSNHAELNRVVSEEIWFAGGPRPLWNGMGEAVRSLAAEAGRRVILVLANGANTASLPGRPGLKEVEWAIARDGVLIYGISLFPRNQPSRVDEVEGWATGPTLEALAHATGGGYLDALPGDSGRTYMRTRSGDDLVGRLAHVVEELRHQYMLGFVPTRRDGSTGTVDVRVKRPGAMVSARKRYVAPAK